MSNFTPKTWADYPSGGTPITATELNRMEEWIKRGLVPSTSQLPAGTDLDTVTQPSRWGVIGGNHPNQPEQVSGVLTTYWLNEIAGLQKFEPLAGTRGVYQRFRGSLGWSSWQRIDGPAVLAQAQTYTDTVVRAVRDASPSPPSSFKTVPLALTVGRSASTTTATGAVRIPLRYSAKINRWRVHIANINPRFGTHGPNHWIGGVWLGRPTTTPGQATDIITIGTGGNATATSDYITAWQSTPLNANTDYLLSYSHTTPNNAREMTVGGGYISTDTAAARLTGGTWTRVSSLPFHVWIEAEVYPGVPVIASFGDSLSSGVGADLPVYESWLSQYCRTIGALPVHYTASGDTMAGWSDPNHYKWTVWEGLSRPDAVVSAMGSNDVFNGATLAELQGRWASTSAILAARVSPLIYAATILPRTQVTGAPEDVRRTYNSWLASQARDVYGFSAAISNDDEKISPGFDADGIHLNAAGYAALAAAITRPPVPVPA